MSFGTLFTRVVGATSFFGFVTASRSTVNRGATPFDVDEANRTLHYAYASYCNETALRAWHCEWCSYDERQLELINYFKGVDKSNIGFVGLDSASRRIVVSYRGSFNVINWLEDAEFFPTQAPYPASTGVKVHEGFLDSYRALSNATNIGVNAALARCPDCLITFTGHSLGAAMAVLGAVYSGVLLGHQTELRTYGCPRVGNPAFAQWATNLLRGNVTRMAREQDIVPSLPPTMLGFEHLPREVWNRHAKGKPDWFVECNATNGEDPACYDSEFNHEPSEHIKYMGIVGGRCIGGPP